MGSVAAYACIVLLMAVFFIVGINLLEIWGFEIWLTKYPNRPFSTYEASVSNYGTDRNVVRLFFSVGVFSLPRYVRFGGVRGFEFGPFWLYIFPKQ